MDNIERDTLYIVNSGKGGSLFVYDSVTGEEKLLETNEDVWRTIRESSTSFSLDTQNYKGDMCTLPKSMGTMVYVNNSYGLYGYLTNKKNRKTKQITLTINFFPVECFDKFKTNLLNISGQWIEVPDDMLKPHGNINNKYIGFTDEEGKPIETKNVYSFLQRRLERAKIEEAQQLTSLDKILSEIALPLPDINDFLSEEEQYQLEEKYAEKEGQHQLEEKRTEREGQHLIEEIQEDKQEESSKQLITTDEDIHKLLELLEEKERNLLERERILIEKERDWVEKDKKAAEKDSYLIEKEKELNIKSDYLVDKQLKLEDRETSVKLREDKLIPLYNIAICTARDRNTQLEIARSYGTKEKEYTREDYLYEFRLKTAMPYETVMIPMSYYRKIRAGAFEAFNVNRDATQYDILGAIRFEDSKSKNLVAMVNYDETQEFIRIVVIKEYNRIGYSDHDIAMFERNYRIWFKEIMGSVRLLG